ncbi:hypothetical protein [Microcoleus sp. OTE_8_concoct_300]|uniref:hypothetical protein n=1 Tax=Microcoleus sp. OTE_8_concoct_300 TaxID=2964710 RepID=UPI00403F1899
MGEILRSSLFSTHEIIGLDDVNMAQDEGWLVIFDRRENAPELEERLNTEIYTTNMGQIITVIQSGVSSDECLIFFYLPSVISTLFHP